MKNEEIVRALRCISTAGGEIACEHCSYWKEEEVPEEERPIYWVDTMHSCDVDRVGLDGADLIERLTDRCAAYAEEIAVAQERQRWIPVTERLPENGDNVNCLRCRFRHEDNGNCTAVGGFCTAVTAAHCPLLRQYLDTGLEPAMCANYKTFEDEAISKGVTFKRIVALMEADRAGRLVVLPCKVGDTVWTNLDGMRHPRKCVIEFANIGSHVTTIVFSTVDGLREQYGVNPSSFGKTVFLTREEAEKALEAKSND